MKYSHLRKQSQDFLLPIVASQENSFYLSNTQKGTRQQSNSKIQAQTTKHSLINNQTMFKGFTRQPSPANMQNKAQGTVQKFNRRNIQSIINNYEKKNDDSGKSRDNHRFSSFLRKEHGNQELKGKFVITMKNENFGDFIQEGKASQKRRRFFANSVLATKTPRISDLDELYFNHYITCQDSNFLQSPIIIKNTLSGSPKKISNILEGHEITEEFRAKMVEWIVHVFTSFKRSSIQSSVHAIQILDQVLLEKQKQSHSFDVNGLHMYGMTSILVSSKYNDLRPIQLDQLIKEAGKNKFTKEQILKTEQDILKTLNFKLSFLSFHDQAQLLIKKWIVNSKNLYTDKQEQNAIIQYIEFISLAAMYKLSLATIDIDIITACVAVTAIERFQSKQLVNENCLNSHNPIENVTDIKQDQVPQFDKIRINLLSFLVKEMKMGEKMMLQIKKVLPKLSGFLKRVESNEFEYKSLMKFIPYIQSCDKAASPIQKE